MLQDFVSRTVRFLLTLVFSVVALASVCATAAENSNTSESAPKNDGTMEVIGAFAKNEVVKSEIVAIPDQKKRLIMFFMGVPLLVFILVTAGLGIALGVYGKRVYVPHMICAGLSVTLAIAHAVVGIVWFYPF